MISRNGKPFSPVKLNRRQLLRGVAAAAILAPHAARGSLEHGHTLRVGQAVVDITPPLGTLMSGFHYGPDNERRTEGVRRPTAARALVLQVGDTKAAILSVDTCGISRAYARRIRQAVQAATGIPADQVRLCATHTHSTATFRYFLQWGGLPSQYIATCGSKLVEVVKQADADLAPAELYVGHTRAKGANFNRTRPTWRTDAEFDDRATDEDRWLDTVLHVLHFERPAPKRNLLWYHFSAHPVCFSDRLAGPDWPGVVDRLLLERSNILPCFLQGHCGDVNPGPGKPWLGVAETTGARVADAIAQALTGATRIQPKALRVMRRDVPLALDIALLKQQIDTYQQDPSQCGGGEWVDPAFARSWFEGAKKWNMRQSALPMTISFIQLDDLGLFFHGSELFSYYGLKIRHASPLKHTLCVGYTDDYVGYLTDPTAHAKREYAASVVPKICGLPPFTPTATRQFSDEAAGWVNAHV